MARGTTRIPARRSFRNTATLALAGSLLLAGSGCDVFVTTPPPISTAEVKPTPAPQRATYLVKRGTVTDAIRVLGRVVSSNEADLSFRNSGRIREVYVQPNDQVQAGQVLAELDQGNLPWQLAKAKVEVERQQIKLDAAKANTMADDTALDQVSIKTSQLAVSQAQLALKRLQVGPTDADVTKAEADIAKAQADLDRAHYDLDDQRVTLAGLNATLAAKQAGPNPVDVAKAKADLETAKVKLAVAQLGPRAEDIKAAEIALDQERTKLTRVTDQSRVKPEDLQTAKIEIEKAKVSLQKVQADIDANKIKKQEDRDTAIAAAKLDIKRAQANYDALSAATPDPADIKNQQAAVQLAEVNLAKVKTPPAQQDIDAAQAAVNAAQVKLDALSTPVDEGELASLKAQIKAQEMTVETAKNAIAVAQTGLDAAQARLVQAKRGPTEFDLKDAQNKITISQAAVGAAQAHLSVKQQTLQQAKNIASYDTATISNALEQAKLDVKNYQDQTGDVKIVAPFAGTITRLAARPGDTVQAFFPVLNVSSPEGLEIKADISEADLDRIHAGMPVTMTMDAYPNTTLNGTIEALPEQVVGSVGPAPDRSTRIKVSWPGPGASMGMLARVQITLQVKDGVLKVPNSAVHTVGKRKFVEYMDGEIKRTRNVETGITTETETEITTGLDEGMVILAGGDDSGSSTTTK